NHRKHAGLLLDLDRRTLGLHGLAAGEGTWLADYRFCADDDREVAVCDGAGFDSRRLVHDDRAGAAVDNHLRVILSRADIQAFHIRDKCHTLVAAFRRAYLDCPAVQRLRCTLPEFFVDRIHDALGIGKVRAVKLEPDDVVLAQRNRHGTLDGRTAGDPAYAQVIDLDLAAAGGRAKAPYQQVALSHAVDLSVGPFQRRHQ